MKLLNSNRTTTALAVRDERHELIAQRYGSAQSMLMRFAPGNLRAIVDNASRSVEVDVPKVVSMMITYGKENMASVLRLHIAQAMKSAGVDDSKINREDVDNIALDMLSSPSYRTLNMALALGFFHALRCGEYKLYGCKPIDFMTALNEYCKRAHEVQDRLIEEQRRIETERRHEEDARNAVTFEQYCISRGLDPATTPNPLNFR